MKGWISPSAVTSIDQPGDVMRAFGIGPSCVSQPRYESAMS